MNVSNVDSSRHHSANSITLLHGSQFRKRVVEAEDLRRRGPGERLRLRRRQVLRRPRIEHLHANHQQEIKRRPQNTPVCSDLDRQMAPVQQVC